VAPAAEPLNLDPNVHWFASWNEKSHPPAPDFIVTPSNVGGVANAQLQYNNSAAAAPSRPMGLLVETPLSSSEATSLFNSRYPMPSGPKAISYVFGDFEGPSAGTQTSTLVNQVRTSTWSKNAYVGNFDFAPYVDDRTRRGPAGISSAQYSASGVNMANTALYPGAASYRNASTNDWGNNNIRTGLFIGPLTRFTQVQAVLDSSYSGTETLTIGLTKHKHIPWVTRFNNWGNASLDTDGNAANGYAFVPGVPLASNPSKPTAEQMMGRGDFSAQILHYRMRGAYSVNLFAIGGPNGGGAIGYDATQANQDVRDGWYGTHANSVFAATDNKRATMTHNPIVDGVADSGGARAENTGTFWSGVYSLGQKKLDILASNLDTSDHRIKFGTVDVYDVFLVKNGSGYTYDNPNDVMDPSRNYLVEDGMHRLLEFDLVTTRVYKNSTYTGKYSTRTIWLLNQDYAVFTNNNRNDVGIPEPTTFGMFAAAGSMAVVCRRHRRNKQGNGETAQA
jgi:hypothetical protein